jgi:hypothetical protein
VTDRPVARLRLLAWRVAQRRRKESRSDAVDAHAMGVDAAGFLNDALERAGDGVRFYNTALL